jgi:uncharacterized protein
MSEVQGLLKQAAALVLYQSVLKSSVGQAFLAVLKALRSPDHEGMHGLEAYGQWFQLLAAANCSWQDHLILQILKADNPFARQAQHRDLEQLPAALVKAAEHDLQILQRLGQCDELQISRWVQTATGGDTAPIVWSVEATQNPSFLHHSPNWDASIAELAEHYRDHGIGIFAEYRAFRWQSGQLHGIAAPDPIQLETLVGYGVQRDLLLKNTEFLLAGYPALHVLLYGSRGSGKSSLVKALINHYHDRPLRLIEVAKSDLQDLSAISEQVRDLALKFILFVDDLSFEDDNDAFKALKVVLEGNVTARPSNVVVYATSNRRHLIREFFDDRPRPQDADEIHTWDTVQEKLSFSDRFGLTLTFEPADQSTYLEIVHHLAALAEIKLPSSHLEFRALQWATRHNGRSGRSARQFIDFLQGELSDQILN